MSARCAHGVRLARCVGVALLVLGGVGCGPAKGEEGGACRFSGTFLHGTYYCDGDLVCDQQLYVCRRPRSVAAGGSCNGWEWASNFDAPLCAEGLSCRYMNNGLRPVDVPCGHSWCCQPGPPDHCGEPNWPPCCPGDPRCRP